MSGKVEWEKANCKGLHHDLFYSENELLLHKQITLSTVRKICAYCPIRKSCLEYGFAKERWGMWGGVSSAERNEIVAGNFEARVLQPLYKDLAENGIALEEVISASQVERNWHL